HHVQLEAFARVRDAGRSDVYACDVCEHGVCFIEEEAVGAADLKQASVTRGVYELLQLFQAQAKIFAEELFISGVVAELRAVEEAFVVEREQLFVAQAHVGKDVAARAAAQDAAIERRGCFGAAADDALCLAHQTLLPMQPVAFINLSACSARSRCRRARTCSRPARTSAAQRGAGSRRAV